VMKSKPLASLNNFTVPIALYLHRGANEFAKRRENPA
jgi:hypothetical protein